MMVLVLVPLIAIIPLVGVRVVSEVGSVSTAGNIHGQTLIAQRISNLVSALNDERDLTEVGLAGSGVAKDAQLAAAKRKTTASIKEFDASLRQYQDSVNALPYATQQLGARAEARLGDIEPLRAAIVRLGAGTPTFSAYTTIIDNLLDFSAQLAAVGSDHPLGALVSTLAAIEQIEAQTSSERGYLIDVLDRGDFTLEQKEAIEQAQAQFETASNTLSNNAPTSILNLYQSTVSGDKVGAADGTVQAVSAAAQEGIPLKSLGVSKSTAYAQMTDKLDAVQVVKQQVVKDLSGRASHLLSTGRTQLYENIGIILAVIVLSFLGALVLARSIVRPLRQLRGSALDIADHHLPEVVRRLRDAEPTDEAVRVQPIELQTQDEVGQVARAFDRVHFEAVRLATEQARMRSNVNAIFTNLSRRSESLVLRQLQLIDDLENSEQNPSQLASLFQLDHLATRMRRNNENLLVLAGEEQGRRWNQPVSLLDLVRAATAEVEQYERVVLYELPDVAVAGHAATDVVHLVAELIENATAYSGPETQVLIGARTLAAGDVVLDIADAGIGIKPEELDRINRRLAEPPMLDVAISRRMGLFVVGRLAGKYGIQVRLTSSGATGLNALVRIPPGLLVPVSDLDAGAGVVFDQSAMRPGPHDSYDLSGVLSSGVPSKPVGQPRFDSSYGHSLASPGPERDRRFDDAPAAIHAGPPQTDFPWFRDEEDAGGHADDGFSWFDQPADQPASTYSDHSAPRQDGSPASGRHTYPGPVQDDRGPGRLPIFESTRSQWSGSDGRGLPDPGGHMPGGQPLPGRSGEVGRPPQQQPQPQSQSQRGVDRSSPSWARPGDTRRPGAEPPVGGSAPQGLTDQGLPQRVPFGHRVPGSVPPHNPASQPNAAPTTPRPANLMRERLSSFRQGVRQGKDGTERDGRGPAQAGSDPR